MQRQDRNSPFAHLAGPGDDEDDDDDAGGGNIDPDEDEGYVDDDDDDDEEPLRCVRRSFAAPQHPVV